MTFNFLLWKIHITRKRQKVYFPKSNRGVILKKVTRFPNIKERIETSAVQFGDDWQGLFIRGDETDAIRAILDKRCRRHHKLKKIIDDIMV
jgi:hypothetical protein